MIDDTDQNAIEISTAGKESFRINAYSILAIIFLVVVWPATIILYFTPQLDNLNSETINQITQFYIPTIVVQMTILLGLVLVVRSEKGELKTVGYDRFRIIYLLYAVGFLLFSILILDALSLLLQELGWFEFRAPSKLLPGEGSGRAVWVLLSAIAGFTEETAYRGYLITRLAKLSRSTFAAVLISALAFSIGHLYQGIGGVILILVYGALFSLLFLASKSLWPCILAHFLHDALAPLAKGLGLLWMK